MLKNFRILKAYYGLAKVKWKFVVIEFIVLLIPSLLSILSPILTANVISYITVYDFKNATRMLCYDFGIILVTALLYFIYHIVSNKLSKTILLNTSEYIYNEVKNNKNLSKINSSTMSDIWTFSSFNSNLLYKLCFFIKSIIILGIIFAYNYLISLSLIGVSIVSALLLSLSNKQIQKNNLILTDSKVKSLELFNSIQKGISLENNNYMESTMKYKYIQNVESSLSTNSKITLFYNINNNFISLILKTAVFLFTFYLISQIKATYLTLSVYLILTPYLTSSAQNLIAFFEIFPEIGIIDNILFNFNELKTKEDTANKPEPDFESTHSFKLKLFHCYYKSDSYGIEDADFEIEQKELVQIIGKQNSGKRAIFDLITKKGLASSGSVFLGDKNVDAFPTNIYNQFIYATYKSPYFYNLSIEDNLEIVCGNKNKIIKTINALNLQSMINDLPDGLKTMIDENSSKKLLFFLGLVRAVLSQAKIICIYELPDNFSEKDYEALENIIEYLNKKSTVILFLHEVLKLSNCKVVQVSKSKIKEITHNN